MANRGYRLESIEKPGGHSEYYLVKDVRVRDKKARVTKYIGTTEPKPDSLEKLSAQHAGDLETRACRKKAELSATFFRTDLMDEERAGQTILVLETLRYFFVTFKKAMTVSEIARYEEDLEYQYVNGTTTIEGNTLTLQQTTDLLKEGFLPENKQLREINEVQNFRQVKRYRDKYKGKVDIEFIRHLHLLIMHNIDIESAGEFRRTDSIRISGCDFQVSPSIEIESELGTAIEDYYKRVAEGQHPFIEAVMLHYRFEAIHPFTDGNGRVGRELLNYLLQSEGYPRLLFLGKDRERYLMALRKGNEEQYGEAALDFVGLVMDERRKVIMDNFQNMMGQRVQGLKDRQ